MTRIALSFVLVVSLITTGIVLARIETLPSDDTQAIGVPAGAAEVGSSTVSETGDGNRETNAEPMVGSSLSSSRTPESVQAEVNTSSSESTQAPDSEGSASSDTSEEKVIDRSQSTTTSPPTTTASSTTASTSTTTARETSTGPLVMSKTLPYPSNLSAGEGYHFGLACAETEKVTCDLNASGSSFIGLLDYVGHGMPYLYSEATEGNHDHAWWVAGDRESYRCAYGFMYDKHPNPFGMFSEPRPAEFIARATIVRPFGQSYGTVNDKYMSEGVRYYAGTPTNSSNNEISGENCQEVALDDFDYDGYQPEGPDAIRVGLFRGDGEIGDIRDFTNFTPQVPGHFEFISFENGRATIVFILGATNKVSHVFYYDAMNSGRIAVEVNGQLLR